MSMYLKKKVNGMERLVTESLIMFFSVVIRTDISLETVNESMVFPRELLKSFEEIV